MAGTYKYPASVPRGASERVKIAPAFSKSRVPELSVIVNVRAV